MGLVAPAAEIAPDVRKTARWSAKRLILLVLIVAMVAAAIIAIASLMTGEFSEAAGKSILSIGGVIWFGLLALAGTHKIEHVPRPVLEPLTLAFAVLGIVTALMLIWVSQSELAGRAHSAVWVFSFAAAHASLLVATRKSTDGGIVRTLLTGTVALIAIAASLIALLILGGIANGTVVTITMIVLVLDGTANVLVFLMRRFLAPAQPRLDASQSAGTV